MKFFYYQRTTLGHWTPRGSDTRPDSRSPDGTRRQVTQVIDIPESCQELTLNQLSDLHPLLPMSQVLRR